MVGKLEVAWDGSFRAVGSWDLRRNSRLRSLSERQLSFLPGWWFQTFFIFHNARDVILPID